MWTDGFHCKKEGQFADTNKQLALIEGDIGTREAQVAFAQYCHANPHFAAKLLMGIDLYPFQDIMIRAMLSKDYFLGVCGRGLGKCLYNSLKTNVLCKERGVISIPNLFPNLEFRDEEYILDIPTTYLWNGKDFQPTSKILLQKDKNLCRVKTRMGYELEGSTNHMVKVLDQEKQEIVWKKYKNLDKDNDFICISRNQTPDAKAEQKQIDEAYLVGLLIGDGSVRQIKLKNGKPGSLCYSYTTMDQQLLDFIMPYTTGSVSEREGNQAVSVRLTTVWAKYLLETYGLKPALSYDKFIPEQILRNKALLRACIQGIADTDGGLESRGAGISICTTSVLMAQQLHLSFLNFGIVSRLRERQTTSGFGKAWIVQAYGEEAKKFHERIGFRLERKNIDYGEDSSSKFNTNTDVLPGSVDFMQKIQSECGFSARLEELQGHKVGKNRESFSINKMKSYSEIVAEKLDRLQKYSDQLISLLKDGFFFDRIESIESFTGDCIDFCDIPDGSAYWSNGFISHNSTIAGVFIPLYALMNPGTTIGITSASFRQCLVEGSRIVTDRGLVKIEEVKPGDKVISSDGEHNEVYNHWKNEPSPGLKITDNKGYSFIAKHGHKVYSLSKGGELNYKEIKDLSVGDVLVRQFGRFLGSEEYGTEEEYYLAGLLLGDGYCKRKTPVLTSYDEQTHSRIKKYVKYESTRNSFSINMEKLGEHFPKLICRETAIYKYIPDAVMVSRENLAVAYIRGLLDADGSAGQEGVQLATSSLRLAQDFQEILISMGIYSSITVEKARGEMKIMGVDTIGRKSYKVRITSRFHAKRFQEKIGFGLDYKRDSLSVFLSEGKHQDINYIHGIGKEVRKSSIRHGDFAKRDNMAKVCIKGLLASGKIIPQDIKDTLEYLSSEDIFTSVVESIEPVESIVTYDISVRNNPSYTSNGFIHHNSREIFEKMERAIAAPGGRFLRKCMVGEPKHKSDAWEMQIGTSRIVALPLGCLPYDTYIWTNSGWMNKHSFQEFPKKEKSWIPLEGVSVYAFEGETRASHLLRAGNRVCKTITLANGMELEASFDHPIRVSTKKGITEWVPLHKLEVGNNVVVDFRKKIPTQPLCNLGFDLGYKYGAAQVFSDTFDERALSCRDEFLKGFICGAFEQCGSFGRAESERYELRVSLLKEGVAKKMQLVMSGFGLLVKRVGKTLKLTTRNLGRYFNLVGQHKTTWFEALKAEDCVILVKCYGLTKGGDFQEGSESLGQGLRTSTVVKISQRGFKPCYDIRVPGYANYCAMGINTHNSGDKIRGYRFNLLVIDELLLLSERIISEVLMPFMAIQTDPRGRQNVREAEDALILAGKMSPEDKTIFPNNKLIGLTSASFQFEYLYKMFSNYKELIYDENAKNVSHGLMQMSCEIAPPGLYDPSNVENARKSFSRAQFDREYMAIFTGDSSGYYSAKKLHEVSLIEGESPSVRLKGDPAKRYLLAMDPNYDASETSDHFGMCLLEFDDTEQKAYMVHGYAVASCSLTQRMDYVKYLFDNFNIVYMIVDRAGGEKFVKDINDLQILPFRLEFFDNDIENFSEEEISEARNSYDLGGANKIKKIVHSRYFSPQWIRLANETLQSSIENKRIWFAAPADADHVSKADIDIKKILFNENEKYGNSKEDLKLKLNDFVDRQKEVIDMTKTQCSLIMVTTTGTSQRFELPSNLKNQTGPDKARKDSYSALLLANWGKECFFAMESAPKKKRSIFIPRFLQ